LILEFFGVILSLMLFESSYPSLINIFSIDGEATLQDISQRASLTDVVDVFRFVIPLFSRSAQLRPLIIAKMLYMLLVQPIRSMIALADKNPIISEVRKSKKNDRAQLSRNSSNSSKTSVNIKKSIIAENRSQSAK
jgi:hypothetical protein